MLFHKGDVIIRIAGEHAGMRMGDIGTVSVVNLHDELELEEHFEEPDGRETSHSASNFKLATEENILYYHSKRIKKEIYENTNKYNYSAESFDGPKF